MLQTRTGGFAVGFRRGWSNWQRDLDGMVGWAKAHELGVIDLGNDADTGAGAVVSAGLRVGSADLKDWKGLLALDPAMRQAAVETNASYIEACAAHGIRNYFLVLLPEDASRARSENLKDAIDGLSRLAPALEKHGGRVVIEGWPGPGALACTPESYRAVLSETPDCIGINYDPSHLIRMGIDPIRFVSEFASRVYHVHGKDTEIMPEAVYEFGTEQPPTLAKGHGFGGAFWRYTIPGHGETRWGKAFEILRDSGYQGAVCVELEDENFNGTEEGEKAGILAGARFLASV